MTANTYTHVLTDETELDYEEARRMTLNADSLMEANPGPSFGADQGRVVQSLARMPSDARVRAIAECVFIGIGDDFGGLCLPSNCSATRDETIVVDGGAPAGLETVIAHEVAHALLGHNIADQESSHEAIEAEARSSSACGDLRGLGADESGQT